jgi:hypothetical protein
LNLPKTRLLAALFLCGAIHGPAQTAATPPVPTTKILALGHLTVARAELAKQKIMPREVRETVQLYLAGKIDQWYTRKDQNGVVFILNVNTVEEAHKLLEQLPLGKAKLMEFDLIPIGPLNPLRLLLDESSGAPGGR